MFAFSTPLLHRHDSQTQLNECWQNQFLPTTKSPATYLYLSSSVNCDHIGFFTEVNGVGDGDADIYYDADGDGGA